MTLSAITYSELKNFLVGSLQTKERKAFLGFTIDSKNAKDLDDAIWIEPCDSGAIILIHVSDTTSLIPEKSQLEEKALKQIETYYWAASTNPLFPNELSENKLSLLEGHPRLTVTVKITLDKTANIKNTQLLSTSLISIKKFSYTAADKTLEDVSQPLSRMLRYCELWAQKLSQKRKYTGAFGQSTIQGISLDEEGRLTETSVYRSQRIIQEFMVLANTAIANLAEQHKLSILYRNHTCSTIAPKNKLLIETLVSLGLPKLIHQKLQNWLNSANYSPTVISHFALCVPAYTHFTSPIRRIADYLNHQILKAVFIEQKKNPYIFKELEKVSQYINQEQVKIKEQRTNYFQIEHLEKVASILDNQNKISLLSNREFSQILKDSFKTFQLDKIAVEAKQRLKQRILKPCDLYYLTFGKYRNSKNKKLIKDELLDYFKEKIVLATQTLQIASTILQKDINYIEKLTPSGQFVFWTIFEDKIIQQPSVAFNKQETKHKSNFFWIKGKLEGTLCSPNTINLNTIKKNNTLKVISTVENKINFLKISKPEIDNPITYVHTILKCMKIKKPMYLYNKVGTKWQCYCYFKWINNINIVTTSIAKTKKEGKANTSLKLIIHLENYLFITSLSN